MPFACVEDGHPIAAARGEEALNTRDDSLRSGNVVALVGEVAVLIADCRIEIPGQAMI